MKIAVCAQSNTPESKVDVRFGRAAWFAIFDDQTGQWSFIANSQDRQGAQGAGIQAAQTVLDTGAGMLIASNAGPKAMAALKAGNIQVWQAEAAMSLEEARVALAAGKLKSLDAANVQGHW